MSMRFSSLRLRQLRGLPLPVLVASPSAGGGARRGAAATAARSAKGAAAARGHAAGQGLGAPGPGDAAQRLNTHNDIRDMI